MPHRILIINPGSTSTKVAVFSGEEMTFAHTLRHSAEELSPFSTIPDQRDFRLAVIEEALADHDVALDSLDAVCCRGGMVRPIPGGVYPISRALLSDAMEGVQGQHASNLGAILGHAFARRLDIPAFVVDPTVVDELDAVARYSGHPLFPRFSVVHALNQKAVARRYAAQRGVAYDRLRLIVCHMGGGISVAAHRDGRMVDVQNALGGEGPFTPERSGAVPTGPLVDACFSGRYTREQMQRMLTGQGGMVAYCGSNNMLEILRRAQREPRVQTMVDAFHYQVAKEIGAMAAVLEGRVDQIILTGGIAHGRETTDAIRAQVEWIAPVTVYPGEDEMLALAQGALRVLRGEETPRDYETEARALAEKTKNAQ